MSRFLKNVRGNSKTGSPTPLSRGLKVSERLTNSPVSTLAENESLFRVKSNRWESKPHFYHVATESDFSRSRHSPLASTLAKPEIMVESTASMFASEGKLIIPTPDQYDLQTLDIRDSNGHVLVENKDFKIFRSIDRSAYYLDFSDNTKGALKVQSGFSLAVNSKPHLASRIGDLERLEKINQQLEEAGFSEIARANKVKIEMARLKKRPITIAQIAENFEKKSRYTYLPERSPKMGQSGGTNPFEKFAHFLDDSGTLCAQCNTSNALFSEFFSKYYAADDAVSVRSVGGFVREGSDLKIKNLHARTDFYVESKFAAHYDVTPRTVSASDNHKLPDHLKTLKEAKPTDLELEAAKVERYLTRLKELRKSVVQAFQDSRKIRIDKNEPLARAMKAANTLEEWIENEALNDADFELVQRLDSVAKETAQELNRITDLERTYRLKNPYASNQLSRYQGDSNLENLQELLKHLEKSKEAFTDEGLEHFQSKKSFTQLDHKCGLPLLRTIVNGD